MAIITAVNLSNQITKLYIVEKDLLELDPGLLTKVVKNLVRLGLVNTKLTWQQDEVILGPHYERWKMEKKTLY